MTIHKYSGRVYEGTIHFKFTFKKEKEKEKEKNKVNVIQIIKKM